MNTGERAHSGANGSRTRFQEVRFQEVQGIGGWAWLIAVIVGASNFVLPAMTLAREERKRSFWLLKPRPSRASRASVLFSMVMGAIAIATVFSMRLVTDVRQDGLYYRYAPMHRGFRRIGYEEIAQVEAVHYNPLLDYGGWGIRAGLRGQGMAFTVKGSEGVLITTKDGRRRLIGSQRAQELAEAVRDHLPEAA